MNMKLKLVLYSLALELDALFQDTKDKFRLLPLSLQIATLNVIGLLLTTLLPWISIDPLPAEIGLDMGGVFQINLTFFALYQLNKMVLQKQKPYLSTLKFTHLFLEKRCALWMVLIGAFSSLISLRLLFYFGGLRSDIYPIVDIRYGFYFNLLCGFGIFFSGISYFFNPCPK